MKEHLLLGGLVPAQLSSRGCLSAQKGPLAFVRRWARAAGRHLCTPVPEPAASSVLLCLLLTGCFLLKEGALGLITALLPGISTELFWGGWTSQFTGTRLEITNYEFTLSLDFLFKTRAKAASRVK